jgi:NAD(P)H-nitrite reductase large subunit
VTETELVTRITALGLRTLNEVRCHTGAGDGCTACHVLLQKYIEAHAQRERTAIPA